MKKKPSVTDGLEDYDVRAVGTAWYTPESWQELCAATNEHAATYEEFVRRFERTVREFAAQGYRVVKAPVDVGLMVKWCRKHGYDIDEA